MINNNVRILKFLDANVKGDIEHNHENFIVQSTIGTDIVVVFFIYTIQLVF